MEQLRYTVSGRVLSLPIRIKRRPLRRWKQEERERTSRTAALSETQGAAHTLAVFNVKKKLLLRGEDRLELFSCHYCHERQVEERVPEEEQVEDKEEEQL